MWFSSNQIDFNFQEWKWFNILIGGLKETLNAKMEFNGRNF